ncbi:dephospho-CoA kinase [Bryocella elongata]|uniref:Dephospho-CoA kinase n=1 Tax=Bryocella elongata TaxID=863522 RepID=A0A1H6BMJ7_9BACT|nr:dephospho-CoA kinase [Bryocella elongata]SEG61921.1 dephospho-CoA kinase [Bryocella elongata]
MLRVGLTGEMGSGKSTVARLLAEHGAVVLSSDEMGRTMMQPGQPVYAAIVASFGPGVVQPDGSLDRRELARLAFDPAHPRVEELNAIVHPAVIGEQARQIEGLQRTNPNALVVVESALIFSARDGATPWRDRFDAIVLVTAPEAVKIARFVRRSSAGRDLTPAERAMLEADARARLAKQAITPEQRAHCLVLENSGALPSLEARVNELWLTLQSLGNQKL